ncbi:hypothetical protein TWF481_007914 [Arthrobotrys musiformis]|uniref:F-box domain-containing protein n=1 Tax=Arthrobotrys musiformis TaxID=47236 RepID=A0AAV9W7J3_9PEZI
MAKSILTLPNEILGEIFSQRCLSNADLTRIQLTCKLFRANVDREGCPSRRYTFRVDAQGHPTWRLMRYLLENPTLGQRFYEINVEWTRRDASKRETWLDDWGWSEEEREKIAEVCDEWCIRWDTEMSIIRGKNSEALLALLLCFTPNLRRLELGELRTHLVVHSHAEWRSGVALQCICPQSEWSDNCEEAFDSACDENTPDHEIGLYLFENLPYMFPAREESRKQGKERLRYGRYSRDIDEAAVTKPANEKAQVLPGLAGLEFFKIGGHGPSSGFSEDRSYCSSAVFQFFLLPRMKSIEAYNVCDFAPRWSDVSRKMYSISVPQPSEDELRGKCRAKVLILTTMPNMNYINLPGSEPFCEAVARASGCLESVVIWTKELPNEANEALARLFVENNKTSQQTVLINGGGFGTDGVFVPDAARRVLVSRRQEHWEKSRALRGDVETKPSPIEKIEPNVLLKITSFLGKRCSLNFLLSSKSFQDPRYHRALVKLEFKTNLISPENRALYNNLGHLEGMIDVRYSPLVSDEYPESGALRSALEAVRRGNPTLDLKRFNIHLNSYPDKSLEDYIANAYARLDASASGSTEFPPSSTVNRTKDRDASEGSKSTDDTQTDDKYTRLLGILKSFSEEKAPSDPFEIHISAQLGQAFLLKFCDMTRLTSLNLLTGWDRNYDKNPDDLRERVEGFTSLFSGLAEQCTRLKSLVIHGTSDWRHQIIKDSSDLEKLKELWSSLQLLQEAVWRLKSVRELTVCFGYICHPSFLLLPPEGVKSLTYQGAMTPGWWRKFANHPFEGVETLRLGCGPLDEYERPHFKILEDEEQIRKKTSEIRLGAVKISGLRSLEFTNLAALGDHYPYDFLELMLQNNPRLSKACLSVHAKDLSARCSGKFQKNLPHIIEKQGKILLQRLQGNFIRRKDHYVMEYLMKNRALPHRNDMCGKGMFEDKMEGVIVERMVKDIEERYIEAFREGLAAAIRGGLAG